MVTPAGSRFNGKEAAESDDTPTLAPVKPNETVKTEKIEVEANVNQTTGALLGSDIARRDGRRGQID